MCSKRVADLHQVNRAEIPSSSQSSHAQSLQAASSSEKPVGNEEMRQRPDVFKPMLKEAALRMAGHMSHGPPSAFPPPAMPHGNTRQEKHSKLSQKLRKPCFF